MLVIQILVVGLGLLAILGSLAPLSRHPHWLIRCWDFPRIQLVVVAVFCFFSYGILFSPWTWYGSLFLLALIGCVIWQCFVIYPYTPLARKHSLPSKRNDPGSAVGIVVSNVLQSNRDFERWLEVARQADPDIIVAVETNRRWAQWLGPLKEDYPFSVDQSQENRYGMMVWSRLELIDPEIRYIVQDDVPSIHTGVRLENGAVFRLCCVHPRPPEPIRNQDSIPRDAELVLVGQEVRESSRPTIVTGDLNDVAWSSSTRIFQKVSGMLDPRMGRGLYNTFHARIPVLRFPLDHLFHTKCFRFVEMRCLDYIGSDHFPIFFKLSYEPEEGNKQEEPKLDVDEQEEAEEKIQRSKEA